MMNFPENLKENMKFANLSEDQLAKKLNIPVFLIKYILQPDVENFELEKFLADGLGISIEKFRGEEELTRSTEEQKNESLKSTVTSTAMFPYVREFLLNSDICVNIDTAKKLFGNEPFPLAEKNLVLYLSTMALYSFCDTQTSSFSFEEYLFKLHAMLLEKYKKTLVSSGISDTDMEKLIDEARSNVFLCDTMENIAILVLKPFTMELNEKLKNGINDFEEEVGLPFKWEYDNSLSKIIIRDTHENIIHEIKLLDVLNR